ncbi:DUF1330 domain-containing protein [Amaricoccus sp.]|uniref:DUF1330 domain-containing protein n=1 Tax=Amaricoccus sp. TaxID=1872485 RepID=UPI001B606A0D|nr:DUF1330 domain-containing protein [Amaricoccus sp.]MBP7003204.1 DUF1330 domain-containing protein [Amaricoccus sp.]
MAAYLVVDTEITDPDAYERYKALARPTVEAHGGEYLARGGALDVLETDLWSPSRLVIIRFPDAAAARTWADSPDYAAVKPIRHGAARSTLAIVEGV